MISEPRLNFKLKEKRRYNQAQIMLMSFTMSHSGNVDY